ncbi:MAG: DUF58 domain-containing protein [Ignavibacteria bacterium]|nr:DUF58 domain-containing protein [Ignavibacteria bacterium]
MKYQQDYRKLLEPEFISKISSLDLIARLVVEGFMVGLHKSPYHGFSVEFSQHRQYMPGDEIQKIDWKAFAKTDKYFVKQYEEETNLKSYIILDSSNSMSYSSKGLTKYQYAVYLASALSYLMIAQNDAVGLILFSDKIEEFLTPRVSKSYLLQIFKTLSHHSPKNTTNTSKCLNEVAEKIRRRGLVIIISDFFDNIDSIISGVKHFRYKKNEVVLFQIIDQAEVEFNFGRDAIFKDLDSKEELLTQPYHIQKSYRELFDEFVARVSTECRKNQIDFNQITTDTPYDKALLSYLKKRKKLF